MSQSTHLSLSSAIHNTEDQVVTPRTPRTKLQFQAEEDYAEHRDDDDHAIDDVPSASQSLPLLSSSRGRINRFQPTPRSHGILQRGFTVRPVIFWVVALCGLFILLAVFFFATVLLPASPFTPAQSSFQENNALAPPPSHPSTYLAQCNDYHKGFMAHGDYWDKNSSGGQVGDQHPALGDGQVPVCSSTITYLFDGRVGLLADLALIAQAAALARERNRTFIIDNTYWDRGRWTDYFESIRTSQPGPEPGCRPPPSEELVACPRTARHWVITAHTAKFHFGHPFSDHYEDPYAHDLNRLKPIYDAAKASYNSAIRPNTDIKTLTRDARRELTHSVSVSEPPSSIRAYIAAHVRRGDRKLRFSSEPYIPIPEYAGILQRVQQKLKGKGFDNLPVWFASDSPSAEEEFEQIYHSPYLSLRQSQNPFLKKLSSPRAYNQTEFTKLDVEERIELTKGMVVDFALLSGMWATDGDPMPIAAVCTISSNVCKTMAIGMGWETAFGFVDATGSIDEANKGWIDLEEKGRIIPVWRAFQLF